MASGVNEYQVGMDIGMWRFKSSAQSESEKLRNPFLIPQTLSVVVIYIKMSGSINQ